jgi:hypothetical protein
MSNLFRPVVTKATARCRPEGRRYDGQWKRRFQKNRTTVYSGLRSRRCYAIKLRSTLNLTLQVTCSRTQPVSFSTIPRPKSSADSTDSNSSGQRIGNRPRPGAHQRFPQPSSLFNRLPPRRFTLKRVFASRGIFAQRTSPLARRDKRGPPRNSPRSLICRLCSRARVSCAYEGSPQRRASRYISLGSA